MSDDSADLAIAAGIAYPDSIRRASEQIRHRVKRQVQRLTGVAVQRSTSMSPPQLDTELGRLGVQIEIDPSTRPQLAPRPWSTPTQRTICG